MFKIFFVFLIAIFSGFSSFAISSYDYSVRIPASDLSCEQEAQNLASLIALNSKATILTAQCVSVIKTQIERKDVVLYLLRISYQMKSPLSIYTARFNPLDINITEEASIAYSTYSECVSDISRQNKIFAESTKLPRLASFCDPGYGSNEYTLKIQGLGEPKAYLQVINLNFTSNMDDQLRSKVVSLMQNHNSQISIQKENTIYFYADRNTNFMQNHFADFKDPVQCETQLGDVKNIFESVGITDSVYGCYSADTSWLRYELGGFGFGFGYVASGLIVSSKYYSFEECMQDKAYQVGQRLNVIGAICSPDLTNEDQYILEIFKK